MPTSMTINYQSRNGVINCEDADDLNMIDIGVFPALKNPLVHFVTRF